MAIRLRSHGKLTPFGISRVLCAAALLILWSGSARAASAAICDAYAKEAAAKANGARQFACGYDLKHSRWVAGREPHARWCRGAPEGAVVREMAYRRGEMKLCQECRAYARTATEMAAENSKLKCGFSGARWSGDARDHFGWCMALSEKESGNGSDIAASYQAIAKKMETSTHSETLERIVEISKCKSR